MQNAKRVVTKRRIARTAKAKRATRKTASKKSSIAKRLARKSKQPLRKARIARRVEPAAPQKSRCLFHYTSGDGLIGILESGSIHASHYSFLNDQSEGGALREVLLPYLANETRQLMPKLIGAGIIKAELLEKYGEGYYEAEVAKMFDSIATATDKVAPYFIASFCMHDAGSDHYADGLLSQWRGYARGGFAIEFDEFKLDALTILESKKSRLQGIMTREVTYRDFDKAVAPEQFSGFAATLFKAVLLEAVPKATEILIELLGNRSTEDFFRPFLSTVPFLKNSGFEEEQEYRIVALSNRIGVADPSDDRLYKKVHFRTRADGRITPYIKLFDQLDSTLPIKSIVVGPHPHQDAQIAAARLIAEECEVECNIRASKIPFRE